GNIFELGINCAKLLFVSARANEASKFFDLDMCLRKMALETFEKRRNAPEEHAGVPMIVAASDVFLRDRQGWFFREAANWENWEAVCVERVAHALDVTEAGFGARRRNTEDDHAAGFASHV